ncbi:cell division protein FtsZ [Salmonella enterica]|nr:cell division protein FtsZ [Salmonella enterica]MDJ8541639.1 cell division protein FtsZ [Salmonella enterica]
MEKLTRRRFKTFRWPAIRHEDEMTNYGTTTLPRTSVVPGMLVKYQGRTYRASANVGKGLYLFTLFERLRTTNDEIEVYLNQHGKPATH